MRYSRACLDLENMLTGWRQCSEVILCLGLQEEKLYVGVGVSFIKGGLVPADMDRGRWVAVKVDTGGLMGVL